ncbi:TELO2-interacting protein 2 [Eublepharis macularius]|uniref:TELO2-interacting protein 2 n=1 Tax=Eublepharis macularius TaxID=481883 RepID=A0AA97LFH4_EUBMA|nr:TELO2-interacting protein 2 [Eublepharis macularius]
MDQHYLLDSLQLTTPGGQGAPQYPPVEQVVPQFLQLFAGVGAPQAGSKVKAGMVRDLLVILEAVDCQWLLGDWQRNSTPVLRDLVVALSTYAMLPQHEPDGGELSCKDSSNAAAASRAAEVILVFQSILTKVEAAKGLEELGFKAVGSCLQAVAGPMYVFAVTHAAEKPWSRPRTRTLAQELLEGLLRVCDCQIVPEFLRGATEDEEGWFAMVMQCLKPELTKETWQRSPATKHVFSWTLQQVTRPWLGPHLEKVLPPSLLLSDDYRVENKILGVQCLHHIIHNVPGADLCQFNRAQVVHHALSNHLYTKEAQLMQAVLPCLLDLLVILERAPGQPSHKPRSAKPSDKVLQLVLTHMEPEHQLALRRVYAQNLPAFIERLSIQISRHLKRLLRVIVGYLEVYDGPEETARLAMLETLKRTIQHAWPRMTSRLTVLLQALLRLMWDAATDRSLTPEPVTAALLQGATDCLLLLDRCSHGQVKILLQGVQRSCQDDRLKEYLRKVEEEPVGSFIPTEPKRDF